MASLKFNIQKKLGDFNLEIADHFDDGITGIFGESGSGKTTLLKLLAGFLDPDVGSIALNEEIYFSSEDQKVRPIDQRRIAMVWQDTLLFPHMTVEENVYYGYRPECSQAFRHEVLSILEIARLANRMPANLSGGEKQRVAIARALLHEPQFLLMDEPVSALDFQARQRIMTYLKKINEQFKIPIIIVSHSISELMFLTKQVLVLENGRRARYDFTEKVFMNEKQLSHMDEDLENIFELPVLSLHRDEKMAELDLDGITLRTAFSRDDNPNVLKVAIKAKDILVAIEQVKGISARNKINAVIERIEPAGEMVMICCRVNNHRIWVEITPGSMRELKLHLSQLVHLIIKARSVRILQ